MQVPAVGQPVTALCTESGGCSGALHPARDPGALPEPQVEGQAGRWPLGHRSHGGDAGARGRTVGVWARWNGTLLLSATSRSAQPPPQERRAANPDTSRGVAWRQGRGLVLDRGGEARGGWIGQTVGPVLGTSAEGPRLWGRGAAWPSAPTVSWLGTPAQPRLHWRGATGSREAGRRGRVSPQPLPLTGSREPPLGEGSLQENAPIPSPGGSELAVDRRPAGPGRQGALPAAVGWRSSPRAQLALSLPRCPRP